MPPRYAYWTIIIDDQPTAFRSASVEELIPTFNRMKATQPTAVLKWFQDGKLWDSRLEARDAQMKRGEAGRRGDPNQRDRPSGVEPERGSRPGFKRPGFKRDGFKRDGFKSDGPRASGFKRDAFKREGFKREGFKREGPWRDGGRREGGESGKLDWKPKGSTETARREPRPTLDWSPRTPEGAPKPEKRPRPPYKGDRDDRKGPVDQRDAKRDSKWRPGGDHRDPRQKYKDAKKAKWTRFKQAIRGRKPPRKP